MLEKIGDWVYTNTKFVHVRILLVNSVIISRVRNHYIVGKISEFQIRDLKTQPFYDITALTSRYPWQLLVDIQLPYPWIQRGKWDSFEPFHLFSPIAGLRSFSPHLLLVHTWGDSEERPSAVYTRVVCVDLETAWEPGGWKSGRSIRHLYHHITWFQRARHLSCSFIIQIL